MEDLEDLADPEDLDQTDQGVEVLKVHRDLGPCCLVEVGVEVVHKDPGLMSLSFPQDSQCNLHLEEVPKVDHRAQAAGVPHQECGVVPAKVHESFRRILEYPVLAASLHQARLGWRVRAAC